MNDSTFGKRFRPVRFFCGECGKELFQGIELVSNKTWTLGGMIEDSICSDCLLAGEMEKIEETIGRAGESLA
jgi:hypothetical protein